MKRLPICYVVLVSRYGLDGLGVVLATGRTCEDQKINETYYLRTRIGNSIYAEDGLDKLTSGYVGYLEPGKCNHGSLDLTPGRMFLNALDFGINKDDEHTDDADLKYLPRLDQHDDAYNAAIDATMDHLRFTGRLLKDLYPGKDKFEPSPSTPPTSYRQNDVKKATGVTLFPRGTSLAFGISGSQNNQSNMLEEMSNSINTIVNESNNRGNEVKQYVLTSGGGGEQQSGFRSYAMQSNEDTNRVLMTTNGNNLLKELDMLIKAKSNWGTMMYAPTRDSGCAEFPSRKLKELVVNTNQGGNLFYRTDASAEGQESVFGTIEAMALKKGITIYFLVSGSCASEDNQLKKLAHTTGGHTIIVDPPKTDMSKKTAAYFQKQTTSNTIRDVVKPFLGGKLQSILLSTGIFEETKKSFSFPVDQSINQLVVTVFSQDKGSIGLLTPGDETVVQDNQGASITELANGRMFVIDKPEKGSWKLNISNDQGNAYSVSVKGNSSLAFTRFQFHEKLVGRHGFNYFPLTEQNPVQGKKLVKAYVNGFTEAVQFQFRDVNGTVSKTFQLSQVAKNPSRYKDMVEVASNNAFRVYIVGRDAEGGEVQRVFPRLFHSQVIAIKKVANKDLEFSKKFVRYEVTNLGADDNILITIRDQLGLVNISRTDFIPMGKVIKIDVKRPDPSQGENDLTVTAISAKNQSSGNRLVGGFAPYIAPDDKGICDQIGIEIKDITKAEQRASVRIIKPKVDSEHKAGDIAFEGTAAELITGDWTDELIWSSNINGNIGTGGSFTSSKLSVGKHEITAGLKDGVSETIHLTVIKSPYLSLKTSSYWFVSKVTLNWKDAKNGADIYRDNKKIDTGSESGSDYFWISGKSTFKICSSGTNNCSASIRSK